MAEKNYNKAFNLLERSLEFASDIEKDLGPIPRWQARQFLPYIEGDVAETYVKMALAKNLLGRDFDSDLQSAETRLTAMVSEGREDVAKWALSRLAEISFARKRIKDAADYITQYADFGPQTTAAGGLRFTEAAYAEEVLLEADNNLCDFVGKLERLLTDDNREVFPRLVLADIYQRHRATEKARKLLAEARFALYNNHLWYGDIGEVEEKIKLIGIKADLRDGVTSDLGARLSDAIGATLDDPGAVSRQLAGMQSDIAFSFLEALKLSSDPTYNKVWDVANSYRPRLVELLSALSSGTKSACDVAR
jgi:tetratricopeptide (TPR) repeat protein